MPGALDGSAVLQRPWAETSPTTSAARAIARRRRCVAVRGDHMPKQILKRDGCLETWSTTRIANAILKGLKGSGIKDPLLSTRLAKKVEKKLAGIEVAEQEHVQDMVQEVLMENRLYKVAERYIIYREKRRELRNQNQAYMDTKDMIETYLDRSDWRVAENSNMVHSFQGLILHMAGSVQARYVLEKYPEEVRLAHEHGYFHIHDLSQALRRRMRADRQLPRHLAERVGRGPGLQQR